MTTELRNPGMEITHIFRLDLSDYSYFLPPSALFIPSSLPRTGKQYLESLVIVSDCYRDSNSKHDTRFIDLRIKGGYLNR